MNARQGQSGFSLIELTVVLAMTAILLGTALPALERMKQRQHLQLLAQTMMTDIQQARSEAVQQAANVQLRVSQHPGGSCYLIHTGTPGQCRCDDAGQAVCEVPAQVLKLEWVAASRRMTLTSNVQNMNFQARQGSVTPAGRIEITSGTGESIRHIVSIAGRVRSCSPTSGFNSLPRC